MPEAGIALGLDHRRLADEASIGRDRDGLGRSWCSTTHDHASRLVGSMRSLDPFRATGTELQNALGDVRIDGDGLGRDAAGPAGHTSSAARAGGRPGLGSATHSPASQTAHRRGVGARGNIEVAERFLSVNLGGRAAGRISRIERRGRHKFATSSKPTSRSGADVASATCRSTDADERRLARVAGLRRRRAGIERMLQTLLGTDDLRRALAFAFDKAERDLAALMEMET